MELDLFKKSLDYSKKRNRWVYALGILGVTSYGAYKVYHLPSVVRKRQRLLKLLSAFVTVIESVSDSAEAIGVISRDFKEFIQSDLDEIPTSLKQISKITGSDEFSQSLTRITRALTVGVLEGYLHETAKNGKNYGFSDLVLDKLFSAAGTGFASVVVGNLAKNMVIAFCSVVQRNGRSSSGSSLCVDPESESATRWIVEVLCDEKCRSLIGDCVQTFVSTAVGVYLDRTMHINTFDEVFSGLTNPKHGTQVKDLLVSVCNGSVKTFIRTTHSVLTDSDPVVDLKLKDSSYSPADFYESPSREEKTIIGEHFMSNKLKGIKQFDKNERKMSSTLAVSRNKRLVLDLAGRVTFETLRSFLLILLEKISECSSRSVDIIHEEVIDKGVEALNYVNRKSSDVVTICLSLCLHILNSPWILVPN